MFDTCGFKNCNRDYKFTTELKGGIGRICNKHAREKFEDGSRIVFDQDGMRIGIERIIAKSSDADSSVKVHSDWPENRCDNCGEEKSVSQAPNGDNLCGRCAEYAVEEVESCE